MTLATITIIPKDGTDKLECKNYHPISVLNRGMSMFPTSICFIFRPAKPKYKTKYRY